MRHVEEPRLRAEANFGAQARASPGGAPLSDGALAQGPDQPQRRTHRDGEKGVAGKGSGTAGSPREETETEAHKAAYDETYQYFHNHTSRLSPESS
ncbi:MAG: hypothetical protein A2162_07730 [Deltaproteobacteria bacterium RBG_13_52_11b]|nr:MAG: hypothetical protein A2162_07730 [Deltaproteobacteria bacterium RBG_13_52_11b]